MKAQHNQYGLNIDKYMYSDYRGQEYIYYLQIGAKKWTRVKKQDYFSIKTDSGNWLPLNDPSKQS